MLQVAPSIAPGVISQFGEFQKANADAQQAKRIRAIGEIVNLDTPQQARDRPFRVCGQGYIKAGMGR